MKILLTAINAKYIHSNLAVYSLKAYSDKYRDSRENVQVLFREFTINHRIDEILEELYLEKPDVLCFSCYIWNIDYVKILIKELKTLIPGMDIWLGGPEVSYNGEEMLEKFSELTGVMYGEGEKVFTNLCDYYGEIGETRNRMEQPGEIDVKGIVYRNGGMLRNPPELPVDMSQLPFPYADKIRQEDGTTILVPNDLTEQLEHRIIYYESSRGCPFSCSYCLSSIEKSLRFRDLELVKKEIQFFIDHKVKQVKFVDRTFNCKKSHAVAIWKYILENDRGITNFHFEIGADLLSREETDILGRMRPGLVQLEIGVQSTNDATIQEVSRHMNLSDLKQSVSRIREFRNINLHLDLIAGLPYEDLQTFRKSFNEVYQMYSDQLQLGFLKVLKGSAIAEKKEKYGLVHKSYPPYEVMYTDWLGFDDVLLLKSVEDMVENYYNSGQFSCSLRYLEKYFEDPFEIYFELGKYYGEHYQKNVRHARIDRYNILLDFYRERCGCKNEQLFGEIMVFDLYARENMKTRPAFAPDVREYKRLFRSISDQFRLNHTEHVEIISEQAYRELALCGAELRRVSATWKEGECVHPDDISGKKIIYFDYNKRNPLNHNAEVYEVIWN